MLTQEESYNNLEKEFKRSSFIETMRTINLWKEYQKILQKYTESEVNMTDLQVEKDRCQKDIEILQDELRKIDEKIEGKKKTIRIDGFHANHFNDLIIIGLSNWWDGKEEFKKDTAARGFTQNEIERIIKGLQGLIDES